MAVRLLGTQYNADSYQKYRFSPSENLQSVIFSYLEEKKVNPIRLAVDVGCGSGQGTCVLAAHFEKVVGTDISEALIEAAKQAASFPNVSYLVCPAEELPFEDGSVDLITAFTAAHWFDLPRFMKEVDRVLKPHGCVALSSYTTAFSMHYKDCSERLTEIFTETRDLLLEYADEKVNLVVAEYKEVFESVPFQDKRRVTQILDKIPMSVSGVIGLIQSFSMYQTFLRSDPEAANSLLQKTEQRFLETMGVCSNETQVPVCWNMAVRLFEGRHHAESYQKYRFSPPENLQSVIFSYLEEKKVNPIRLAVDVGCGSGQGTRVLAAHFEKVVGTDISEAQIEAAKQAASFPNVSYLVCPAELLPLEDGSVDLITAFTAAHWFDLPRFMKEVDRVLKPHGCVALSSYTTAFSMHYKDCSESLTEIYTETRDLLLQYIDEKTNLVFAEYKEVFESVPFQDKRRVTQILDKIPMSVSGVIGLIQSFSMYQAFLRSDPETAKSLLQKTEQRFLETMGVCSNETQVPVCWNMAVRLFEGRHHAESYQKYRFSPPENLQSVIFFYLEEKKVNPIRLAVDVGCGSGQSTRVLAAHFEKVVGTDISEAQIEAAKQAASFPNVSYLVCPAEELPLEDGSVDLITAFTAAHWFDLPRFMKEVDQVLKPHGRVALSSYTTAFSMHYKDCSERLTEIFTEIQDLLLEYADEKVNLVVAEYKEVFESVPFQDKRRVTQILDKIPMSISGVIGLIQSFSMYQTFLRSDPEAAKSLLQKTEQRFLETMGVCSNETQVEIGIRSVSVLGCKGK